MIKHALMMVLFFLIGYTISFTTVVVSSGFMPEGPIYELVLLLGTIFSLIAGLMSAAFYNYYTENNY